MLDAIADFWKPVKKAPAATKVKLDDLQIGSAIGFGFVPQVSISGKRLTVSAINTYQFGDDVLTSFVLSQDKDVEASMIVAEADGEQYLAISRRMSTADRGRLFNLDDLEAVISKSDATSIHSRDGVADYKGWVVSNYKREIQGMKGKLCKGDFRKIPVSLATDVSEFAYTLLVSDSNEHALEIEKYNDGRLEVYATVYRRLSDIGEVTHPATIKNDLKLDSDSAPPPVPPAKGNGLHAVFSSKETPVVADTKQSPKLEVNKPLEPVFQPKVEAKPLPTLAPIKPPASVELKEPPKPAPLPVPEVKPEPVAETKHSDVVADAKSEPVKLPEFPASAVSKKTIEDEPKPSLVVTQEEPAAMMAANAMTIKTTNAQPFTHQEIKAVNKDQATNFVNESIDCDLPVANKIIDEAIRNEMRINDVVRRVIGLPVSAQESVQIPVTLTDQDYSLLAIRYGISASDRDAIKRRITEDLGDFSGLNKQKKAA